MNPSNSISIGAILEDTGQGGVEKSVVVLDVQNQVERRGPRTIMPPRPILRVVSPEAPNLWGAQGDLGPVVANEEEVVRFFLQPVKVTLEGDVPTEDTAEYFGWEFRNVQQRVANAFEPGEGDLVLSYLLLHGQYGFGIDLALQPVLWLDRDISC